MRASWERAQKVRDAALAALMEQQPAGMPIEEIRERVALLLKGPVGRTEMGRALQVLHGQGRVRWSHRYWRLA